MARRPTQFGAAQVKQKDAVRPLLVLLLIGAGGILLFLWLQSDTVDPVVAVADEEPATADASPTPEPAAAAVSLQRNEDEDLENWWLGVESQLVDALDGLRAAKEGSCGDLENSVADLGAVTPRREQPIQAPFSAVISSLDRALAGCRDGNDAIVEGGGRSARAQMKSLAKALTAYGIQPSDFLSEN